MQKTKATHISGLPGKGEGKAVQVEYDATGVVVDGRKIPRESIAAVRTEAGEGKKKWSAGRVAKIGLSGGLSETKTLISGNKTDAEFVVIATQEGDEIVLDFGKGSRDGQRLAGFFAEAGGAEAAVGGQTKFEVKEKFEKLLADQLLPGEQIEGQAQARAGEAIFVTDRRVMIAMRGMLSGQGVGQRKVRSWMYNQIANVEFNVGMTQGYLEIQPVGGSSTTGKDREDNLIRFPKSAEYQEAFRAIQRLIQHKITESSKPQIVVAAAAAAVDPLDQIKKLADLHAAGILSDEEFASKKAALLDTLG